MSQVTRARNRSLGGLESGTATPPERATKLEWITLLLVVFLVLITSPAQASRAGDTSMASALGGREINDMTIPNFVDCATGRSCRFLHRDLNHLAKVSSSCLPA